MGSAAIFLKQHPELRQIQQSQVWRELKERYKLRGEESNLYVVRGDTIGDEDDLFVDALARGSSAESPDPLARRLFEELPADLQALVLDRLRKTK